MTGKGEGETRRQGEGEKAMSRRAIKRRRGEGISISGPATIHVNRRVTLVIEAAHEAAVSRLSKRGRAIDVQKRTAESK